MNDIIISGNAVENTIREIVDKIYELGFKNNDPCTMFDDINAMAIAISIKNDALIYGAFNYLKSGKGFENPNVTAEMWRSLYKWILQQYIYREE